MMKKLTVISIPLCLIGCFTNSDESEKRASYKMTTINTIEIKKNLNDSIISTIDTTYSKEGFMDVKGDTAISYSYYSAGDCFYKDILIKNNISNNYVMSQFSPIDCSSLIDFSGYNNLLSMNGNSTIVCDRLNNKTFIDERLNQRLEHDYIVYYQSTKIVNKKSTSHFELMSTQFNPEQIKMCN